MVGAAAAPSLKAPPISRLPKRCTNSVAAGPTAAAARAVSHASTRPLLGGEGGVPRRGGPVLMYGAAQAGLKEGGRWQWRTPLARRLPASLP